MEVTKHTDNRAQHCSLRTFSGKKARHIQGCPMTLHGNTMSPASPLPVATFATGMYCSPRLTESRGQTQLEEAAVGTSAETQLNNKSGTCLCSGSFQDMLSIGIFVSHRQGQGTDSYHGHLGPCSPPQCSFLPGHSSCRQ